MTSKSVEESDVEYVNLVGGESLIHLYSPQMLRALSEYSVKTSVVTNTIVVREELKIKLDSTGRE